jgi:hypothetical protein
MSKSQIQVEDFVRSYLSAAERGLTREAFAKELGIAPETVYQRVYSLNRLLAKEGRQLPTLPTSGRRSIADRALAAIEAFKNKAPTASKQAWEHDDSADVLAEILG